MTLDDLSLWTKSSKTRITSCMYYMNVLNLVLQVQKYRNFHPSLLEISIGYWILIRLVWFGAFYRVLNDMSISSNFEHSENRTFPEKIL